MLLVQLLLVAIQLHCIVAGLSMALVEVLPVCTCSQLRPRETSLAGAASAVHQPLTWTCSER